MTVSADFLYYFLSDLFLCQGVDSFGQAGNFSGCCILVINAFLGSFIDDRNSIYQSCISSSLILSSNCSFYFFDSSLNCRLSRFVALVSDLSNFDSLLSRFNISQPVHLQTFVIIIGSGCLSHQKTACAVTLKSDTDV